MNCCTRHNVVALQGLVVGQLLSRVNQSDLVDLDSLFFLQGLLDDENLVLGFEIEGLLTAGQRLDEDLCRANSNGWRRNRMSGS